MNHYLEHLNVVLCALFDALLLVSCQEQIGGIILLGALFWALAAVHAAPEANLVEFAHVGRVGVAYHCVVLILCELLVHSWILIIISSCFYYILITLKFKFKMDNMNLTNAEQSDYLLSNQEGGASALY